MAVFVATAHVDVNFMKFSLDFYKVNDKMFLIECINDNSYCIVEDDDVYGDGKIEEHSVVHFDWNGRSHEGVVKMKSESQTDLKKKLKELQTIDKANKTPRYEVKEKRQRKENEATRQTKDIKRKVR
ncbi:unnamed protein product [Lasius platythorax]|uniref:Uncharacterized protein n=1 Tax=Lasius platythorax TaxID=488582 RepID=A0AAV2MXX8_9HYME